MVDRVHNVLFLPTGNTARSILAEAMLNKDGAGRFRAFSAGSQPTGTINPFALKVLHETSYSTEGLRSKAWDEVVRAGIAIREKGTPYTKLGLSDPTLTDEQLVDALVEHPILIDRPLVVTLNGIALCRPSEVVSDLPAPRQSAFVKEDGERVVDVQGRRVAIA